MTHGTHGTSILTAAADFLQRILRGYIYIYNIPEEYKYTYQLGTSRLDVQRCHIDLRYI